jgi:peroxiredoxin
MLEYSGADITIVSIMSDYYTLLGIAPTADQDTIDAAYQAQRARYRPELVAELDGAMRRVAQERTTQIEQAYHVLSDPQRRHQYDAGLNPTLQQNSDSGGRRGLSPREIGLTLTGVVLVLVIIGTIWMLTGNDTGPGGQAMGEIDRPAPDFSLDTLDGPPINLANYRGQIVLLNFWATWCEPCKRELPALQTAYETYADDGLMVIGINLTDDEVLQGSSENDLRDFIAQYGVTYPIALDHEGRTTNDYRVFPLPTSFFIDGAGRIRYAHIGELTLDDISARFNELRADSAATTPGAAATTDQ